VPYADLGSCLDQLAAVSRYLTLHSRPLRHFVLGGTLAMFQSNINQSLEE
jgi:hypothetical protein